MEFLTLVIFIGAILSMFLFCGVAVVILSAVVMHYWPESAAGKFLDGVFFDAAQNNDDVF